MLADEDINLSHKEMIVEHNLIGIQLVLSEFSTFKTTNRRDLYKRIKVVKTEKYENIYIHTLKIDYQNQEYIVMSRDPSLTEEDIYDFMDKKYNELLSRMDEVMIKLLQDLKNLEENV
jgi:hypothetical protein